MIGIQLPDGRVVQIDTTDPQAADLAGKRIWANDQASQSPQGQVGGFMANVNRGTGIGDELAAAGNTVQGLLTGRHRFGLDQPGNPVANNLGMLKQAFQTELSGQRGQEDTYAGQHPNMAGLARGLGMAATTAVPGANAEAFAAPLTVAGHAVPQVLANAMRGATVAGTQGAAFSALDRGTGPERLKAASQTATNPLVLALGGVAGAAGTPRTQRTGPAQRPQDVLAAEGVSLTPGQRAGGLAKNVEDLAQRAPLVGPAIRGARQRGVGTLNLAVANRALAPLGETVPGRFAAGHEASAYVADRLGQVYDEAAALVPSAAPDAAFATALATIRNRIAELPADVGPQFDNILQNRLTSRLANGPVSGADLRDIQSQLGTLAAQRSSSQDAAQRQLGEMLDDVSTEVGNIIARSNPEAGALIERANEGWANYVRLRNAGSRASGAGVASPGQLSQAIRSSDRSVGKGNVARGGALLQDLTGAASQVMPDAFGNPGTADATGLGALLASVIFQPHVGVPAAAGLGAAAIPYMRMGRGAVTPQAAADPIVEALRRALAARTAQGIGVAGATQGGMSPSPSALATAIQ